MDDEIRMTTFMKLSQKHKTFFFHNGTFFDNHQQLWRNKTNKTIFGNNSWKNHDVALSNNKPIKCHNIFFLEKKRNLIHCFHYLWQLCRQILFELSQFVVCGMPLICGFWLLLNVKATFTMSLTYEWKTKKKPTGFIQSIFLSR